MTNRFTRFLKGNIQLIILLLLSLLSRWIYLFFNSFIVGDAVTYCSQSKLLATGMSNLIDPFWFGIHYYWTALIHKTIPSDIILSCNLASFIPSLLIVFFVYILFKKIVSEKSLWIIGVSFAVHPRLLEYAANGYPTSLYLLLAIIGISSLVLSYKELKIKYAVIFGLSFGLLFSSRTETSSLFAMLVCTSVIFIFLKHKIPFLNGESNKKLINHFILIPVSLFCFSYISYLKITTYVIKDYEVMSKGSIFAVVHTVLENRNTVNSAHYKATFSENKFSKEEKSSNLSEIIMNYISFFFKQGLYSNIKIFLFKVVLSPLFIFMLYYIYWSKRYKDYDLLLMPLYISFIWPFLFFSFFWTEPRHLFIAIFPAIIIGSIGLEKFFNLNSISLKLKSLNLKYIATTIIIVCSLSVAIYQNRRMNNKLEFQLELSSWVKENLRENEKFYGDGHGYGAYTSFYSKRLFKTRPWMESLLVLENYLTVNNIKWIILYEEAIKQLNPELSNVFTEGINNYQKVYEVVDNYSGNVIQVYQIDKN